MLHYRANKPDGIRICTCAHWPCDIDPTQAVLANGWVPDSLANYKIIDGEVFIKTADELRLMGLPAKYKSDGGVDVNGYRVWIEKSQAEKDQIDEQERILSLPERYRTLVDGLWVEKSEEDKQIADMELEAAQEQAIEQEETARQASKPLDLKRIENDYIKLCDTVTGSAAHVKLTTAQLKAAGSQLTDQSAFLSAFVELMALKNEAEREYGRWVQDTEGMPGQGTFWWDDCCWHPEIEE